MLTRTVFFAGFLIAINGIIDIHAASFSLDFMKDPRFPGNKGWMDNLMKSFPWWKNQNFPGDPEWQKEFEDKMDSGNMHLGHLEIPQPMVPCFPKTFPHPPKCDPVADPGFKYPEVKVYGSQSYRIEYKSFMCSDPDYSEDSFYMLQTAVVKGENNRSETSKFYNENGEEIAYSPKIRLIPANEDCD